MEKVIEINLNSLLLWVVFFIIGILISYITYKPHQTNSSPEFTLEIKEPTTTKVYTIIQNYTESKTEDTISPKSEYRIYIKEVQGECHSINGEAFLFSENGSFETTINNSVIYLYSPFRGNLSIYFSLEDGNCEVNDVPRDIKIIFAWQNVSDNETLFFNISRKNFHYPEYLIEFTNFVRPQDVKWFIDSFRNQIPESEYDALDYIKKRAQVDAKYYFDMGDYWQFPNETLKRGYGDCEDFSTLLLSLFKAYNENLKCYNLVVYRHLTTFCILYFEKDYPTFAFFDQGDTRIRENWYNAISEYEKCNRIRALVENFYSTYGLTPVENKVFAAFDDKNIYTFDNMDEFCKWIISIA